MRRDDVIVPWCSPGLTLFWFWGEGVEWGPLPWRLAAWPLRPRSLKWLEKPGGERLRWNVKLASRWRVAGPQGRSNPPPEKQGRFAVCVWACGHILSTVCKCLINIDSLLVHPLVSPVQFHHFPCFITCIFCLCPLLPVLCVSPCCSTSSTRCLCSPLLLLPTVPGCFACLPFDCIVSASSYFRSFSSCSCLTPWQNFMCPIFMNFWLRVFLFSTSL